MVSSKCGSVADAGSGAESSSVSLPAQVDGFQMKSKSFLNFAWGRGDEIVLFSSKSKSVQRSEWNSKRQTLQNGLEYEKQLVHISDTETCMVSFSWDQTPDESRRMVHEGHQVFLQLESSLPKIKSNSESLEMYDNDNGTTQVEPKIATETDASSIVLEASKRLRGCMDEALMQLEKRMDPDPEAGSGSNPESDANGITEDKDRELWTYCDKLKFGSMAWHLCEILLLERRSLVGVPLVHWVYTHFPRFFTEEEQAREMDIQRNGSRSKHFWSVVYAKVLRGDTRGAWDYLSLDTKYLLGSDPSHCACMEEVRHILLSMPRFDSSLCAGPGTETGSKIGLEAEQVWTSAHMHKDASVKEYERRFLAWNQRVRELYEKRGGQNEGLRNLLGVLRGDIDTLMEVLNDSSTDCWAHVLAACLLYYAPTTRTNELRDLVQSCFEFRFEGDANAKELLLTIFAGEYTKALQLLHVVVGDRWLTAHLCELLARAGAVESVLTQASSKYLVQGDFLLGTLEVDIREYFLLEYVMQLALKARQVHSPIDWQYALAYLKTLDRLVPITALLHGTEGEVPLGFVYAHIVIERQYPITDRFVSKLVHGCRKAGLTELKQSLLRQRVMYWWCLGGGRTKFIASKGNEDEENVRSASKERGFVGASNALLWSQRAGHHIANSLLTLLFEQGTTEALNMLVDHMSVCTGLAELSNSESNIDTLDDAALTFLSEYKDIRLTLREGSRALRTYIGNGSDTTTRGDERELEDTNSFLNLAWAKRDSAARKLVAMLKWHKVPRRFWGALVRDTLLWETDVRHSSNELVALVMKHPVLLTMDECSVLINTLEQLEFSYEKFSLQNINGIDQEVLSSMRLILLQAMARAVIITGVTH